MGLAKGEKMQGAGKVKSDGALIEKVRKGDRDAFKAIYGQYQTQLLAYVLGIIKSRPMADDIVQEAFIKVWLKRGELDPDLNFSGYLFKVAKNLVLNQFTKIARDERLKQEVLKNCKKASNPTQNAITFKEYQQIADKIIEKFPPQQRLIYKLSRHEGKNNKEIAAELHLNVKTVQNHLGLALNALKKDLRQVAEITLPFLPLILFS